MRPASEAVLDRVAAFLGNPRVLADVESVYADADEAVSRRQPVCNLGGRCCRFAEFGHCLFVTTPELIHFVSRYRTRPAAPDSPLGRAMASLPCTDRGLACPLQVDDLCSVYAIRPLGCRVFFCEPGSDQWGCLLLERLHGRMKKICQTRSVPYAYVEWTGALAHMVSAGLITPCPADV